MTRNQHQGELSSEAAMSGRYESDESGDASHALHDLLADLNTQPNHLSSAQTPTWTFPSTSSRNSPSPRSVPDPPQASPVFSQPTSSRNQGRSTAELGYTSRTTSPPSAQFTTPTRSIFSSGPPTSSLSANTAQASMSAPSPVSSTRPLSSLALPGSGNRRRSPHTVHYQTDDAGLSGGKTRTARAEKEVDDPSISVGGGRPSDVRNNSTPTALSRLFTAPEATMPTISRNASYFRTNTGTEYKRVSSLETAPLPNHLYNRGLLSGRHSDINVHAFGTRYALHRLLLDRAPFFASALSEPWFESTSKDITLHPQDMDSNITQTAFELALKRLYGSNNAGEEDKEAIGLFATGCWLEMADLIESSVTSLLSSMRRDNLASLIRLVTINYYGKPGDRILASAKAMLCREGWEMPLRYWDGISGDIIREIVGGDGFFVPGELERWILAKRLLDRRLRSKAIDAGLFEPSGQPRRAPSDTMNFLAVRFDTTYRNQSSFGGRHVPEAYDPWIALYTDPDVAALLVLLDEGIHYVHLSFEELQCIRGQKDVLGVRLMPEKVISDALWMSMELRQKIVNAQEQDMELGLCHAAENTITDDSPQFEKTTKTSNESIDIPIISKGKCKEAEGGDGDDHEDLPESGSWDGNGMPRKFWIPNSDSTSVMGGNPDAIVAAANGSRPYTTRQLSRFSASIDPQDVQWASDFSTSISERPTTPGRSVPADLVSPISYSNYPPFRFAAEFPNPRNLKEKKRVYSRTVWYAGSLWNVYIQKVETPKNTQLGVYLHRAKEKEGTTEELATATHGTVDERIGRLERGMRIGKSERRNRRHAQVDIAIDAEEDTSGSGGDLESTLFGPPPVARTNAIGSLLRGDVIQKASQSPGTLTLSSLPDRAYEGSPADSDKEHEELTKELNRYSVPTLPPYIDGRPTIKTYFKIYSPSKGGRMLSVYESAPDKFNFSQSWGWKSSTMILDDGLLGYEDGIRSKDGRLRFMVVIGNV